MRRLVGSILLAVSAVAAAAPAVVHLASYRGQVQKIDAHTARVTTTFATSGGSGPLTVIIPQWEGDHISGLTVSENGRTVGADVHSDPAVLRVVIPQTVGTTQVVAFKVEHPNGDLYRIPIAVPSAVPISGQHPVDLDVTLPAGDLHYGDLFPRMDWHSETSADTTLGTVPSLMILHSRPAATVTVSDWWSASRLADLGMALLLLLGSVTWWMMYRSGKAPAGGH